MKTLVRGRLISILLVEGDPGDTILIQKAFELGRAHHTIHAVKSGKEAASYLRQESEFAKMPKPDLIVLDIEVAGPEGPTLLKMIKSNPDLAAIPVVALTHSSDSAEIIENYRLHANCLIQKPVQVRSFLEVIKAIDYFWTEVVTLPQDPEPDQSKS